MCVLLVKVIVKEGERGYYKTVFINILMLWEIVMDSAKTAEITITLGVLFIWNIFD